MTSFTSRRFRDLYSRLPGHMQTRARSAYRLFRNDPTHPGLHFKKIDEEANIYSVRIGLGYRALGRLDEGAIIWFWIGPHAEYDKLMQG